MLYDLVIVGGGIGGVITLRYALERGLRAIVLERASGVGGLWRRLPAWQDLQIRAADWTLGDLPIGGHDARSVTANIEAWVTRFSLAEHIITDCEVTGAARVDAEWRVQSSRGDYRGRYLANATGAHNTPNIPAIERRPSSITERHSSTLHNPQELRGKRVVVVGGGSSAQDVLAVAVENGAAALHWVYRSLKWFIPTKRSKHEAIALRYLGRRQLVGLPESRLAAVINARLPERYARYGVADMVPARPFDYRFDQLVPWRANVLASIASIDRHVGEVAAIADDTLITRDGKRIGCDVLVWGTGYTIDLSALGLADLTSMHTTRDVARACHGLLLSRTHENLFLIGSAALDSNGSSPFSYAHMAKAVAKHVSGRDAIPKRVIPHQLNYMNLVAMLATADRRTYPPALWRIPYFKRLWLTPETEPLPLP